MHHAKSPVTTQASEMRTQNSRRADFHFRSEEGCRYGLNMHGHNELREVRFPTVPASSGFLVLIEVHSFWIWGKIMRIF